MNVEKVHGNFRYTLTNKCLAVGDEVFPIAWGKTENGLFLFHELDYSFCSSGFPDDPHIIKDLNHSDYKPYEIHTNKGYGPVETYFRIMTKEEIK
jgi:hypothetical protein